MKLFKLTPTRIGLLGAAAALAAIPALAMLSTPAHACSAGGGMADMQAMGEFLRSLFGR